MFKKTGLKFRLTAFICTLTIISTIWLSNLVSQYSSQQIIQDQGRLLEEIALSIAGRLGQDINSRSAEIEFLSNMSLVQNPETPVEDKLAIFENMKQAYPFYAWLGMTDNQGNIIVGTDGLLVGKNVKKREWFIEGSKGLHFGDAHDAFLLAKLMPKPKWDDLPLRLVDVSAPVVDKQGKLIGVICGHLSVDWAFEARQRMLANYKNDELDLVVLNKAGKVLMGTPSLPSLKVDLSYLESWKNATGKHKALIEDWPDHQRYLTVSVPETAFNSVVDMNWSIVVRKPEILALEPATKVKKNILFIGLFTSLILGFMIWFFIGRQLEPLEQVSLAARKIQNDDNIKIPKINGHDEIATFAGSLTELVKSLKEQNNELKLTNRIFHESGQGILITDSNYKIIKVNKAFTRITQYSSEESIGKKPSFLSSGRHPVSFYKQIWKSINEEGYWSGEIINRNKQGHIYPEWLKINVLKNDNGEVCNYIGIFDDISDKKEYEQKLLHLANYDSLTNLPNRHSLQLHIKTAIEQSINNKTELALLFIDLDKFKNINDTKGHVAGDKVLKEVASRFSSVISDNEILARWGGDEFVVLLPSVNAVQAKHFGDGLLAVLKRPFEVDNARYHIGGSIGIALFPNDSQSVDGLLRCADTAMYEAKHQADNTCKLYENEMNQSVQQFLKIDNAIRQALANKAEGLSLAFQPQYTIDGKRIVGMEVLVRWHHQEFGFIPPDEFIPVLEETNQIVNLGNWITEEAFRQYARIKDQCKHITLSINCSTQQIMSEHFLSHFIQMSKKYSVPPQNICMEVTESAIMSDEVKASSILQQARAHGFSISIDDFGTGFSCLHYVQKIHPDEIKIDKSFVQLVDTDNDSKNIVSFTVGLAKSLNLDVVAEGVETESQLAVLKEMDNVTIQGYLYSKPVSFEELKKLLT